MKISDSTINMAADRSFEFGNARKRTGTYSATSETVGALSSGLMPKQGDLPSWLDTYTLYANRGNELLNSGTYNKSGLEEVANTGTETVNTNNNIRDSLLDILMQRMMEAGFGGNAENIRSSAFSSETTNLYNKALVPAAFGDGSTMNQVTYFEKETTSFSSKGRAITEDGRTIDFSIDVMMSRSYVEYTEVQVNPFARMMMDPLMINVGRDVANIKDQRFFFDLNADGEEEEITLPGKGTGFLALDKNGDGIINDGSELFGAMSGDGFADLREYDSDGNGWIDENDEIFEKLMVWYKNGDGEDRLVNLKEADIGAIYLGEQQTDFTLTDGFSVTGRIRSTGIFLHESTGEVGTVQHIDLAVRRPGEEEEVAENSQVTESESQIKEGDGTQTVSVLTVNDKNRESSDDSRISEKELAERRAEEARKKNELKKEEQERLKAKRAKKKAEMEEFQEKKRLERENIEKLFQDRKEKHEETMEILEEGREAHIERMTELSDEAEEEELALAI